MPKLKTRKSLAKRIKITKKGKALRSKTGRRHLLSSKDRKRKRNLRRKVAVLKGERILVRKGLPYG